MEKIYQFLEGFLHNFANFFSETIQFHGLELRNIWIKKRELYY